MVKPICEGTGPTDSAMCQGCGYVEQCAHETEPKAEYMIEQPVDYPIRPMATRNESRGPRGWVARMVDFMKKRIEP